MIAPGSSPVDHNEGIMATMRSFSINKYEDGLLTINLSPPIAIGGVDVVFRVLKRYSGESGLIVKSCGSGFGSGQSGISIIDSGQGMFQVYIASRDTSGLDTGTYVYGCSRTSSGQEALLVGGPFNVLDSAGP